MYTGPMYMKYNLVLRGMGAGRHTKIHEEYERVCKLNTYAPERGSIIAGGARPALLSLTPLAATRVHDDAPRDQQAIIKLSKLTSATKLYRGVSGALLPRPFWTPNQYNVRGGVEVAFMSCTEDKEVRAQVRRVQKNAAIVFEVKQGMVDRGADVAWLSQYPHEKEITFQVTGRHCRHHHRHLHHHLHSPPLPASLGDLRRGDARPGQHLSDRGAPQRQPHLADHRAGGREDEELTHQDARPHHRRPEARRRAAVVARHARVARSAAEHRDAAEFNRGAHYRESTTQALDVQQEVRWDASQSIQAAHGPTLVLLIPLPQVFKMLGDEANTEQPLSHETLPEARAARRVAELCARAGEKIYAVQLLRRAADQQNESRAKQISRWQGARGRSMSIMKAKMMQEARAQAGGSNTPSPPMTNRSSVASVAAASSEPHASVEPINPLRSPSQRAEESQAAVREKAEAHLAGVPESEHWRIVEAAYLLKGGAEPPWPATLVELVWPTDPPEGYHAEGGPVHAVIDAFVALLLDLARPPDPWRLGAQVMVLDTRVLTRRAPGSTGG